MGQESVLQNVIKHNTYMLLWCAARLSPISIDKQQLKAGIHSGESAVHQLLGQQAPEPSPVPRDSPYFDAGLVANGMEPYLPSALQHVR